MADILFDISNVNELILKVRGDANLYTYFKNFEDGIAKIFEIDKKSSVLDMSVPLLWNFNYESLIIPYIKSSPKIPDIYNYILDYCNDLKIDIKVHNGFVICGKILESITDQIGAPAMYDIYFYDIPTYLKFAELIKNEDNILEIKPNCQIKFYKKIYSSPIEILLSLHRYTSRFCFDCRKVNYYGTVMFYLDLDKLCYLNDGDIVRANMYFKVMNDRMSNYGLFHQIINSIDIDKLRDLQIDPDFLNNLDHEILDDEGLTAIERSLKIYFSLENPLLQKNMKDIIDILCGFTYRRPPFLFAYAILQQMSAKVDLPSIYDPLNLCANKYNLLINSSGIKLNVSDDILIDINTYIIRELIYQNIVENIIDFIKFIGYKDFEYNVLLSGDNMLRVLLPKIYVPNNSCHIYELILRSEMIDTFNTIGNPLLHQGLIKMVVPHLLENSCYISLLYLIKMQYPLFKIKYSKPLLHFISDSKQGGSGNITENDFGKAIKFFYKYSHDFFYFIHMQDKNGDTFLHRLSINKGNLVPYFLKMSINKDVEIKTFIQLQSKNKNGDTFLHTLVRKKNIDVIRSIIDIVKPIIDLQNNNGETSLIIAARNGDEIMFSLLKKNGANENIKDKYGNTVFHYMCMNDMFIGSVILETANEYGYKPSYYTTINNYWNFTPFNI